MAAGMTQAPVPPDQEGSLLDEQGSLPPNYTQNEWGHIGGVGHPVAPPDAPWQGEPPLTSGFNITTSLFAPLGGHLGYGPGSVDGGVWDSSGPTGPYGQVWPISPMDTFPHSPWAPADGQPLPSPISEVPSHALTPMFFGREPNGYPNQSSQSGTNSPATTDSTLPTPLLQPGDNHNPITTKNPPHLPPPKRPAESAPRPPRPRTLKRHRSDTPSIASIASISTTGSASTVGSAATTLGGVLPANVDPRVASEQICREVRERSKAEALEMSQRRMMLLDHEQGALERETHRLQVNLGLMREAAKREQAGLQEEEEERAGRAQKWLAGG